MQSVELKLSPETMTTPFLLGLIPDIFSVVATVIFAGSGSAICLILSIALHLNPKQEDKTVAGLLTVFGVALLVAVVISPVMARALHPF